MKKLQSTKNSGKPNESVSENEVREVLLEHANRVSQYLQIGLRAHISIEPVKRNGIIHLRALLWGMPADAADKELVGKMKDSSAAAANSGSHIATAANFTGASAGMGSQDPEIPAAIVCLCKQLGR